jgi:hypothetical protein
MYPVYAAKAREQNSVMGEAPLYQIDWETRASWDAQGAIYAICGGRAVRLQLNLPPRPQGSQTMGAVVLDGIINRIPYALACQAAWRPHMVPA